MTTSRSDEQFHHVMIDIESMSLHPTNALILSIGMVEFDPDGDTLRIGKRALITPRLEPQLLLGRHVDPKTQKFWAEQPILARDHWLNASEHWDLARAIADVREFCAASSRVWANGTQFDLSNLVGLNDQLGDDGQPEMWHYRAPRDARTYFEENAILRGDEIAHFEHLDKVWQIVPHEPVSDCITQAHRVWQRRKTVYAPD